MWNTLVEIHSHFSMVEVFALAMFMVSLRYHAHSINTTIRDHIPNPPKVNYAVDRSETELLSIEQTQSSFKRETNLPDSVDVKVGSCIMFFNNSLMASGISNGSTAVISECAEDGYPNVHVSLN